MSPIFVNGRQLGVAQNGIFTEQNTDPIPGGRLWPEAAMTWMAMRVAYVADGGHPNDFVPGGPNSSARTFAAQQRLKDEWTAKGQPQKAATPGTSNHGWGIAVDAPHAGAQAWLLRRCAEFGWSHDEGQRVGEAWHFRYVGAAAGLIKKLSNDKNSPLTDAEKRWVREYDHLKAKNLDLDRRRVLRRVMTEQRKRIWRSAQKNGWTRARKQRYATLLARTT